MGHDPNWAAYFALLLWPLVALCLYSALPVGNALLWTILGAHLLLPVGAEIKFAGIPAFDKNSIPNLTALVCCTIFPGRLAKIFRGLGIAETFVVILLVGPLITSMLNTDPVRIGAALLPGVGAYDALSAAVAQFIFMIPFFLARQFLRRPGDNEDILRVLAIAGLAYSLPILFEIRMSPQLHVWIYGYFPTGFADEIRDGGFRPVVFLGHGLLVAFFVMTATVAALALRQTRTPIVRSIAPGIIVTYLGVILLMCKTASAALYAALLVPLVRWANPRWQLRVASVLVLFALTYPLLRAADLIPTASILNVANSISPDRAASLKTRFDNEDQLLAHAWERPWFGWGRFGRNRIYNDWNGGDASITDGHWIITMGIFGVLGFLAEFGLLGLSVFRAAMAFKYVQTKSEGAYLAALALIVAINMIDLLPNSSISPWSWLLVGALLGRAEGLGAVSRRRLPFGETSLHTSSATS